MNPRDPLPAASEPAAQSEFKGKQHARQSAATFAKNHPNARRHDPHAQTSRPGGFRLPGLANLSQKIASRRGGFIQNFLAPIAVITDGRSGNQNRRTRVRSFDAGYQMARDVDAAARDPLFLFRRPTPFAYGFPRQMEHYVDASKAIRSWRTGFHFPVQSLHVRAEQRTRSIRVAGKHDRAL